VERGQRGGEGGWGVNEGDVGEAGETSLFFFSWSEKEAGKRGERRRKRVPGGDNTMPWKRWEGVGGGRGQRAGPHDQARLPFTCRCC
jgi:hypothetical protein